MEFLGKSISGPFTIPSGIVTCYPSIIQKIANEIPEIGVITTKSIGLNPRAGYREPILTEYTPNSFLNAVGLANPGAKAFAEEMQKISIPKNRFLLTSIFGKDAEEFVKVATIIEPFSDGIELNLSCPHAEGYGMSIGQDAALVKQITAAVKNAVKIPVIPKLTPNVKDIPSLAKAAIEGGADALTAINTVGPETYSFDGHLVLTNKVGGKSGREIFSVGLDCVQHISKLGKPVIGCGGIATAGDVKAYAQAGASVFGVGSALTGMTTDEIARYFRALKHDLAKNTNTAESLLKHPSMSFKKYVVKENRRLADDLSLLVFDKAINIKPGEFVFVWIPEIGEKPFSVLDDNPMVLAVAKRGSCTEKLVDLKPNDTVYIRGPYGIPLHFPASQKVFCVCGGTGYAALYKFPKQHKNTELFMGARDKNHLYYIEEAKRYAKVHVSTNDGSYGEKGFVTDLLKKRLVKTQSQAIIFLNCGPPAMIEAAEKLERQYAPAKNIYNSVDYVTKCGVGICGSCYDGKGRRSCVDGPFLNVHS